MPLSRYSNKSVLPANKGSQVCKYFVEFVLMISSLTEVKQCNYQMFKIAEKQISRGFESFDFASFLFKFHQDSYGSLRKF